MDREKERREQEAFDRSTFRRLKRGLLRGYMQACMNYFNHAQHPAAFGLARLELVAWGHMLKLAGFKRFSKLRAHARNVRSGKAKAKRKF